MRWVRLLFLGALLAGAGCSDSNDSVHIGSSGQASGPPPILTIENASGEVALSLTNDYVSMQLSKAVLKEIGDDFTEEREEKSTSHLANSIKNTVLDRVENLLNRQLNYPIQTIDRITWDDGKMVFTLNSEHDNWDSIWIDGDSVLETFKEDDALRFIEAFEKVKAGGK